MHVVVVLGDLVDSRLIAERGLFQRRLEKVLAKTSASASRLKSPYTITLGDEFQAVYRGAESLFADVVAIIAEIHPVQARFIFGVGELTTRINPRQALGMDGPAFHQARTALTALKNDGRLLRIAGTEEKRWALANCALNLIAHQLEGWNRNRLLVLMGLLQGKSVREIEQVLRISRVAIYKNIRAAALDDVVSVFQQLAEEMNRNFPI